jgi:pyruvate/2-oxoglutarate dehydrogenase complex dihydrolipoamide acyltransferase (E2) component
LGLIGTFQEVRKNRGWGTEMLSNMAVKNRVYGLIELDVTRAREYMRSYSEKTGETLSFTGWIIKCIGQAVSEDKQVQAYKKGRNSFVIFDDVDVSIAVEREVKGEKIPVPYVVRKANEKSFKEIHDEIRAVQVQKEMTGPVLGSERTPRILNVFQSMPSFLRKIGWWKFRRDPFLKKRMMGTVGITSVGMFGSIGGWPINIGFHSLEFALGGISKKLTVVDGRDEVRQCLSLTVMFDEDVIYGAPAARFTTRLAELVQDGYGLVE